MMKELQELFNSRVTSFLASGKVEEKIDGALAKCFDDCIDSAFRWGDLKKSIEEVISSKMQISLDQIEIQSYNAVLEAAIKEKMKHFSSESAAAIFSDAISGIFSEAPKEVTMQELAETLINDLRSDDGENYGEYFHVVWDENYRGSYTFKIMEDAAKYSSALAHIYLIDKDGYHYLAINHEMDITNPTCLHGMDQYLFQLYAARTKITDADIFDPDDLDTRRCDAEY